MATNVGRVVQHLRQVVEAGDAVALRDGELVDCFIRTHAEDAFAALVERHGPMILGVCRRILQNTHDAEDAFQATFLVLARRAATIRRAGSVAAWLHGIALRVALNMKREASIRHRREQQASPRAPEAPADLGARELHLALDEELQRLPAANRQPLLLCYLEGLTQEAAAHQLGWPRGTLKRRLERGRALLMDRLTKRGLTLGAALLAALAAGEALAVPLAAPLASATIKAGIAAASGAVISAEAAALAEGVIKTMFLTKLAKWTLAVLLVLAGCGLGLAGYSRLAVGDETEPALNAAARLANGFPDAPRSQPNPSKKGAKDSPTAVTRRFEDLARQLEIFQTEDLVGGFGGDHDSLIPKRWTEPWHKNYAAVATAGDNVADLVALLKHSAPKVRTLALAALFERQDPHLLPHFAAMMGDQEKTAPEVSIVRAFTINQKIQEIELIPEEFRDQTVGHVAKRLLETWLEPAGHKTKDFAAYWAARKDRRYCASWFLARYRYAGQASSSHFDLNRAPRIRAIRKEIDALPPVEREWMLVSVATSGQSWAGDLPPRAIATPQELLAAGKRLGPDRLMAMLRGEAIGSDPDLSYGPVDWTLRHSGALLRTSDIPELLTRPPWGTIGAADLQPANASKWLHAAIEQRSDRADPYGWDRAELAAALWRIVGPSEFDYLADWFYRGKLATNPFEPPTGKFLAAIKGVRAPADRKLAARLITDPRLDKLDYRSVRDLVELVNGWTKEPVIDRRALWAGWERSMQGPETPRDFALIPEWRRKLRDSVEEWKAR